MDKLLENIYDLAEFYTAKECKTKRVQIHKEENNGDIRYTEKAQDIFIRHLNDMEYYLIDEPLRIKNQ